MHDPFEATECHRRPCCCARRHGGAVGWSRSPGTGGLRCGRPGCTGEFGLVRHRPVLPVGRARVHRRLLRCDSERECNQAAGAEVGVEPDGSCGSRSHRRRWDRDLPVPRGWHSDGIGDRSDRRLAAVLDHGIVLGRSRRDSHQEFEDLARSLYADLHGYLRRQVSLDDVDDVVAEALAAAWRRWSEAPPTRDRKRAWVFGIAQNKVRELHRGSERRRRLHTALSAQPQRVPTPMEGVGSGDRVRWFLDQLPEHERASVYLMTISGFTAEEAGEILGHPGSTISGRVTRALHRLRPLVAGQVGGDRVGIDR